MGPLLWLLGGGLALGGVALALRSKDATSSNVKRPVKIGVSVLLRDPAKVLPPFANNPSAIIMLNAWTAQGGTIDNQVITVEASRVDERFLQNAALTAYYQAVSQGKQCNGVVVMNDKTETLLVARPSGNVSAPLNYTPFMLAGVKYTQ